MSPIPFPELPYDYEALAPVISGEIMHLHHEKHHKAYVTNFNAALEKLAEAQKKGDISAVIALQSALRFNGGGHLNHCLFWDNLASPAEGGGTPPVGPFADALKHFYGSLEQFIEKFNAMAVAVQGSGWGWLGWCRDTKTLVLHPCPNQDPLHPLTGLIPLLGIDVWEHAYYPQYKNARAEYLKNIWKVVNWKTVAKRYEVLM